MTNKDLLKPLCAFLTGTLDWNPASYRTQRPEDLVRLSSAHGLHSIFFHRLSGVPDKCSAHILELLKTAVVEETKRSLVQQADIQTLADHLTTYQVPFLVIKGAVLAHMYYPSPNLRPRADTDIFIDQSNIESARNSLCRNGYQCEPLVTPISKGQFLATQFSCRAVDRPGYTAFDMHWKINNSTALGGLLSFDNLFTGSILLDGLGHDTRAPNLPFSFIIACIHWTGEPNKRLIWLYDIHVMNEFMESRDWECVIGFAVEKECVFIIQSVLKQTTQWFGTVFPPGILERMDRSHAGRPKEKLRLLTRTPASPLRSRYVDFLVLPWRQRPAFLWAVCFPPKSYLALQNTALVDISKFNLFLHYVCRPFRSLTRHRQRPVNTPPV